MNKELLKYRTKEAIKEIVGTLALLVLLPVTIILVCLEDLRNWLRQKPEKRPIKEDGWKMFFME